RYPEAFANAAGKARPPDVLFYRRNQIESVLRKRQLRDRAFPNLDSALLDPFSIGFAGHGDALLGMIQTVDFSLSRDGRQLAHRSASATTNVEDVALRWHRDVRQAPVGYLGMAARDVS